MILCPFVSMLVRKHSQSLASSGRISRHRLDWQQLFSLAIHCMRFASQQKSPNFFTPPNVRV